MWIHAKAEMPGPGSSLLGLGAEQVGAATMQEACKGALAGMRAESMLP